MIITCINCNKKFDIDTDLIPKNGRLLQCSSCNHKWFFKQETKKELVKHTDSINKSVEEIKQLSEMSFNTKVESAENIELLDDETKKNVTTDNIHIKNDNIKSDIDQKNHPKKNYNILGLTIVFITSFIALIIILDTFQGPISIIVPNIEFLLYNLYETINDIKLFLNDLI
tara:strand:+ start:86 stop:598 length:513 start_codon:yes stop_codon:yes gene_type:complete